MFGYISRARHDAAIAAKNAKIEDLCMSLVHAEDCNVRYASENAELRTQLARYTAPRERGEGGRFLPLKRVQA